MTITPHIPIPVPRYQPEPRTAQDSCDPPTVRIPIPYPPLPLCAAVDTPPPVRSLDQSSLSQVADDVDARVPFPRVGETVQGFTLVEELGRGAFARVFLAKQDSLANRLVAVKITRRPTREAEKLARLQHANIVPIHSVHASDGLHLICMPMLGRRTIADALRAYQRDHPSKAHSGRKTWGTRRAGTTAIDGGSAATNMQSSSSVFAVPDVVSEEPWAPLIGDVLAVLRTLSALAAGLAHAHARHILHLDIKPANVLLAESGEPMLLDFNLSLDRTETARDLVGGTVQYMAPEQLLDVRTRGQGRVDARSDLYSLGVLGYEMLTACVPYPTPSLRGGDFDTVMAERQQAFPSARTRNPQVTPAVDAILRKLLAPDPEQRYQSADELRTDLERQLNHEPLQYAVDRSPRERFRKWRRRHPRVLGLLAAMAMIAMMTGSLVIADRQAAARGESQAVLQAREARSALAILRLDLILPDDPTAQARGAKHAQALLERYGLPEDPLWRKRAAFARLPVQEQARVAADLGEVVLLRAHMRWSEAKLLPPEARVVAANDILAWNLLARTCYPEGAAPPLLERQYIELAEATGQPNPLRTVPEPSTSRDHFLDAVELLTTGRYAAAIPSLEESISRQPDHAAAQFCLALCRHKLGQHARALERYDAARVLMPADPRPYVYRGLVLGLDQKHALAAAEFGRAITLEPGYALAYQNRAVARFGLNQYQAAEEDLTTALDRGGSALQIRLLRARVRVALGDMAGAEADRIAVRDIVPEREADFLVRGWTRLDSDPSAALADFEAAEKRNPRSIPALEKQGFVLAERLNQPEAALAVFTRLSRMYPEYVWARVGRAVLLARLDRRADAHEEANRAHLLSNEPGVTYRLACVFSRTSTATPGDRSQAMTLLRQAYRDGFRDIRAFETDCDLDPLRNTPEFREFLRAAKELAR